MIRSENVMLDADLARLYDVSTKALNQAVSRNADRFPEDLMFQLNSEEFEILRSQFVTSSWGTINGSHRGTEAQRTHRGFLLSAWEEVVLARGEDAEESPLPYKGRG